MKSVHIVCQPNTLLDSTRCAYGALRATYELARCLNKSYGYDATLYAEKIVEDFYHGVGCRREAAFFSERDSNTKNLVIGISRGDCFRKRDFNIVYHHGPHHVLGIEREQYGDLLDAVVCVSRFSRDQQINYGVPARKITILPNGIDTDVFGIRPVERRQKSYLYVGQIRSYKGVARLLEAFEQAVKEDSGLELALCGENLEWGSGEEGFGWLSARGFLDSSSQINWRIVMEEMPNVRYLGEKTPDELAVQYSSISYLVCPSIIPETFGLVSLEGQACGCIPILAGHGGYLETIVKGCPRFLFKPWDTGDLKEKILATSRKIISENKRSQIADRAQAFNWDSTGQKFASMLNKKLNSPVNPLRSLRDQIRSLLFK